MTNTAPIPKKLLAATALVVAGGWIYLALSPSDDARGVGTSARSQTNPNVDESSFVSIADARADVPIPSEATRTAVGSELRVVVSREGNAISKARVVTLPWRDAFAATGDTFGGIAAAVARADASEFVTDSEGLVTVASAAPDSLVVLATAPECAPGVRVVAPDEQELVIELDTDKPWPIRVVDELGAPIAGATASASFDEAYTTYGFPGEFPLPVRTIRSLERIEGVTDAAGLVTLRGIGNGVYALRVGAEGRSSELRVGVIFEGADPKAEDVITLVKGARISGTVRDAATGEPIANARVEVQRYSFGNIAGRCDAARSAADGSFVVQGPADGFEVRLLCTALGRAGAAQILGALDPGQAVDVDIALGEARRLKGRIVEVGTAAPVASAYVVIEDPGTQSRTGYTRTDAEGVFVFDDAPVDVPIMVHGYLPTHSRAKAYLLPGFEGEIELAVQPYLPLAGKLEADAYPLIDPVVRLGAQGMSVDLTFESRAEVDVQTGEFEFAGVPGGRFTLDAEARGYARTRIAEIEVPATSDDRAPLAVRLERGVLVRGTVVAAGTREPMEGALVSLACPSVIDATTFLSPLSAGVATDAAGGFEVRVPPGQKSVLVVTSEGYAEARDEFVATVGATAIHREIALEKGGAIEASLVRPDGRPAGTFLIECTDEVTRRRIARNVSGARGTLDSLPSGRYRVQVSCLDHVADALRPSLVDADVVVVAGQTTTLVFDLSLGSSLRGTLHGAAAERYQGDFLVAAVPISETRIDASHLCVVNRATLEYGIHGLPAGRYRVSAEGMEHEPRPVSEREIEIDGTSGHTLDFQFGGVSLTGSVTDPSGKPANGARVEVRVRASESVAADGGGDALGVESRAWATVGTSGRYVMEGLVVGRWPCRVVADGFARIVGEVEISSDVPEQTRDFVLEPEALLRVGVVDRQETIVEGATIDVVVSGAGGSTEAVIAAADFDDARRALVRELGTGTHLLRVRHDGYFPHESPIACVGGREQLVRVTLRRPVPLALKLKAMNGAVLTEASISIEDIESGANVRDWIASGWLAESTPLVTDREGRVRIEGLPEGRYRVRAAGIDCEVVADGSLRDADDAIVLIATI
jgi:hypothetical protein